MSFSSADGIIVILIIIIHVICLLQLFRPNVALIHLRSTSLHVYNDRILLSYFLSYFTVYGSFFIITVIKIS